MKRVSIVGGSGFVGGELARWLLDHEGVELAQMTSERLAGQPVERVHPHLRGRRRLRFVASSDLEPCDVLIAALPHGQAAGRAEQFAGLAPFLIDCSADHRLMDPADHLRWYGEERGGVEGFAYGLPEVNREALRGAQKASGVGCNATAVQLALLPLERAGLLPRGRSIVANVLGGSSEGGASSSPGSHHPVRAGSLRSYAPVGHRHTAEVLQTFAGLELAMSVTATERVRGAHATCHVQLAEPTTERELLGIWRNAVRDEPFLDVLHERAGAYRAPDPKLVTGTNRAQLGFALDASGERVVALAAIDNLGKGAAGSAVQSMNLMLGLPEAQGLDFHGLHPL